ncbi:MAG: hypothetical protein IKK21_09415 [Clostridia bacterium]|nr:hypothetical protein [Clostridia bacterium]
MIARPVNSLIFRYDYLPQINEIRLHPQDGGFSLELYQNNMLVISLYDLNHQATQCMSYQMPTQMKLDYLALVDKHADTLRGIETRLMLPENQQPRYFCRIGLEQMEMFILHDIEQMAHLPFSDPAGHKARMLYVFMEELAEKFMPYGITFTPRTVVPHQNLQGIPVMQPWHPYHTGSYYQTGAYQETSSYRQTGAHAPTGTTGAYSQSNVYPPQDASNY